jgi:uncharacterized protein
MNLLSRITADMKEAMKSKNNATLSTLRLLLSALKYKQIDVQHALSDEEVQGVIKTQVKQLNDSILSYDQGARGDLVESAKSEIAILETYLPAQLADDALEAIVKEAVAQSGAKSKEDTGKAMGAAMKAVAEKADGTRVKQIVEGLLRVFVLVAVGASISLPVSAQVDFLYADLSSGIGSTSDLVLGLRIVRVLLLWIGLFAVNTILSGSFAYMTSGGRDKSHDEASSQIASGFVGSIVVVILFVIATVYIQIL